MNASFTPCECQSKCVCDAHGRYSGVVSVGELLTLASFQITPNFLVNFQKKQA